MRWLVAILLLLPVTANAQVGMPWPGPGTVHSAGGGGFTGSGDAVAGASGYYGLFAYTSALRGTKAINLCLSPGNIDTLCQDVNSDPTTGIVSSTQVISGTTCGTTFATNACTIKTWYDQTTSGIGNITQTGPGNRAQFVPNFNGTIPAACSTGTTGLNQALYFGGTFAPSAISFSMAYVERSTPGGNARVMWNAGSGGAGIIFGINVTPAAVIYNGGFNGAPIAITNNTWLAMVGTSAAGGGAVALYVNGSTDTTGGSGGTTPGGNIGILSDTGSSNDGCGTEFRYDGSVLSSGNAATLITNMRSAGRNNF